MNCVFVHVLVHQGSQAYLTPTTEGAGSLRNFCIDKLSKSCFFLDMGDPIKSYSMVQDYHVLQDSPIHFKYGP